MLKVELGAQRVDDRDDGNRNAGRDQAVLNGGGAGIVSKESLQGTHVDLQALRLASAAAISPTADRAGGQTTRTVNEQENLSLPLTALVAIGPVGSDNAKGFTRRHPGTRHFRRSYVKPRRLR